eukprot:251275_1
MAEEATEATDCVNTTPSIVTSSETTSNPSTNEIINKAEDLARDLETITNPANELKDKTENLAKDSEPEIQPQTDPTETLSTTKPIEVEDTENENKEDIANADPTEALDTESDVQDPSISTMDTESDPQDKEDVPGQDDKPAQHDTSIPDDPPVTDPINDEPQPETTSVEDGKIDEKTQDEENEPNPNKDKINTIPISIEANVDPNAFVYGDAAVDYSYGDAAVPAPPQPMGDVAPSQEIQPPEDLNKNQEESINKADPSQSPDDPNTTANDDASEVEQKQEVEEATRETPPQLDTQTNAEEQERDTQPNEEDAMDQGHKSLSLSPRITVIKETWANKRRFGGTRLPLVVCLRCNNHFFVEKTESHFTPTARQRNLKYAFTLIPDDMEENLYQMIHIQSGSYVSVKRIGKRWILYPVVDDDINCIDSEDLRFCISKVSDQKDVNLRVTIGWKGKLLTMKDVPINAQLSPSKSKRGLHQIDEMNANTTLAALNDCEPSFTANEDERKDNRIGEHEVPPINTRHSSSLAHLDGTDKMLVFDDFYTDNVDVQVFILERVLDDVEDEQVDLMFLLDLVNLPRANKIGIPSKLHQKYQHIPRALIELIQQIYVRIDVMKTGYAVYTDVWSQFVQYSEGMLPRVVITAFEDGVRDHDIEYKLIHIKNMISAIDTIIEFYENEIKMERLEQQRHIELRKLDPIDIKLRRLDTSILYQHPFLKEWQNM